MLKYVEMLKYVKMCWNMLKYVKLFRKLHVSKNYIGRRLYQYKEDYFLCKL